MKSPALIFITGVLGAILLMMLVALGVVSERVTLAHQCAALGKFSNYNHVILCGEGPDSGPGAK